MQKDATGCCCVRDDFFFFFYIATGRRFQRIVMGGMLFFCDCLCVCVCGIRRSCAVFLYVACPYVYLCVLHVVFRSLCVVVCAFWN